MPPTLAQRLEEAARALSDSTESPRLDAEYLLAHALDVTRGTLLARLHETREAPGFEALVERRRAHEPIAYILGDWEFFSLPLYMQSPMLIPRPETEHLVEAVLDYVGDRPATVADLCTGTGCVAVAVARNAPACRVVAADINPEAVALARRNAERNGVAERMAFAVGDLFDALEPGMAPLDAIGVNPPYVEEGAWPKLAPDIRLYEDPRALISGADGLDLIRRIVQGAPGWLKPRGLLALEIGMRQYEAVEAMLRRCGFTDIAFRRDLAGLVRIVTALRTEAS